MTRNSILFWASCLSDRLKNVKSHRLLRMITETFEKDVHAKPGNLHTYIFVARMSETTATTGQSR